MSPACAHCYADDTARFRTPDLELWGAGHEFRFFGDGHWDDPLKWARNLPAKLGRRPRVFCASMADVFEERDELDEHRWRLFHLIAATPELDWLLLTKRPTAARDFLFEVDTNSDVRGTFTTRDDDHFGWGCLRNIWLGVSIENARYTWRADVLREIPAAVRFISAEPLLGSLYEPAIPKAPRMHDWQPILSNTASASLEPIQRPQHCTICGVYSPSVTLAHCPGPPGVDQSRRPLDLAGIDWVIIGGESGPKARPFHLEHARELIRGCGIEDFHRSQMGEDAPLAVFVKQLAAKALDLAEQSTEWGVTEHVPLKLRNRKGGDPDEWPADLRIREFPRTAVLA